MFRNLTAKCCTISEFSAFARYQKIQCAGIDFTKLKMLRRPGQPWAMLSNPVGIELWLTRPPVKRYQLKYRTWPKSLDECVPEFLPEVPEDPWLAGAKLRLALEPARLFTASMNGTYHWDLNTNLSAASDCLSMDIISWREEEGSAVLLELNKGELENVEQNKRRREEAEKNAATTATTPNGTAPFPAP